uniref:DEP domain-containing protein n=1 Tax=Timema shepardi TaxID=629360 RepID=A0A7R9ALX5_TIMSH|nr:unnamed protein product [Timema shepardi]
MNRVETPSTQMSRAGWTLRVLLLACDSGAALRDHKSSGRVHRRCATGVELVDWLLAASSSVHSRQQAVGMWQALIEEGVLTHDVVEKKPSTVDSVATDTSFEPLQTRLYPAALGIRTEFLRTRDKSSFVME